MAAPTSAPRLLRVGVLGIGRIGRQQALNCLRAFSQLKLICACSPTPDDIQWASTHLAPYGVATYTSAAEMVSHPDLEAVIIASTTKLHAEHIRLCLSRGLHVLCEKPLAMNSTEARSIVELAAKHPECSIMTAYSRRFDTSYQRALAAVQEGKVGMPVVIRSQTCDMYDRSPFYMRYVMANPGIFIDTTIHDVDLTLSFFGADARPAKVWATGTVTLHPELEEINDFDNAVGVVEWYPDQTKGVPKRISYFYVSRTMKHGFDNSTEIIGTNGSLKINLTPRKDQVEVADEGGIRHDVMDDFYGRYEYAFVEELRVWAGCVLGGKKMPYELATAVKGMEICEALQESLRTGRVVEFDADGRKRGADMKAKI